MSILPHPIHPASLALAKAMTDTGRTSLCDEQCREWGEVRQRVNEWMVQASRAVRETDFTPRATVGEVQSGFLPSMGCGSIPIPG
jgi:hypothetical protein